MDKSDLVVRLLLGILLVAAFTKVARAYWGAITQGWRAGS